MKEPLDDPLAFFRGILNALVFTICFGLGMWALALIAGAFQ